MNVDLLQKISSDLAGLRAHVEATLTQHAARLDVLEPRMREIETENAKTRGYALGVASAISAAFGLLTLATSALLVLR